MRRRRVREIHQYSPTECGLCCIAMLLSAYGSRNSVAALRRRYETGRDGLTIKEVVEILRERGMRVRTFRAPVAAGLRRLTLPLIAFWDESHLVVVERITERHITVIDPAGGRRKYTAEEFGEHYSGLVIEAKPTSAHVPDRRREPSVWMEFLRALRDARRPLLQVLVTSVLLYAFTLGLPVAIQHAINKYVDYFGKISLPLALVAFLVPMSVYFGLSLLRSFCLSTVIRSLGEVMMGKTFHKLLSLPYKYFANRSQGELLYRLSSISAVRDMVSTQVSVVLLDMGALLTMLTYVFLRSVMLGLTALTVLLCMVLVTVFAYKPIRNVTTREINETANSASMQVEALSSIETVKVSGATDAFFADWRRVYAKAMTQTKRRVIIQEATAGGYAVFQVFGPLLVLVVGLWMVQAGRLDLGSAVAAQTMTATSLGTVMSLSTAFSQFVTANVQLSRVGDILHQPAVRMVFGEREHRIDGAVSIRNVGFTYPGAKTPALRGVSFDVRAGQSVAIVGSTGSGKSTLGKLMMGLYPHEGVIEYDGVSINDFREECFYQQVAYVPQEIVLSNRTIAENIRFGFPQATMDDVRWAARLAQIHDDIEAFPMGYHTQVREMGGSLSGGQRQRIALARALVRRPAVLVLDEATSALDTVTESFIAETLQNLRCTRVIIAHRFSTIRNADLIVVLEHGRVAQVGEHYGLISDTGPYQDLVSSQVDLGMA